MSFTGRVRESVPRNLANPIPDLGGLLGDLRKDPDESIPDYMVTAAISIGTWVAFVFVVVTAFGVLNLGPVEEIHTFMLETSVMVPVVGEEVLLFPYANVTSFILMIPIGMMMYHEFVVEGKENLVDNAISIMVYNAIAIVGFLFLRHEYFQEIVLASAVTAVGLYAFVFLVDVVTGQQA